MAEAADDFHHLIHRVRLGDDAALAELARRYEPEVRLTARVLQNLLARLGVEPVEP